MLNINWYVHLHAVTTVQYKNDKVIIPSMPNITEIDDLKHENPDISTNWLLMYELVKRYYEANGNLAITSYFGYWYPNDGIGDKLWNWISSQRNKYNNNKLTTKQIQLLDDIGMIWYARHSKNNLDVLIIPNIPTIPEMIDVIKNNPDISINWLQMYEHAKRYYLINGNLEIPSDMKLRYPIDIGNKLANWISTQRTNYNKNKLIAKQIQLLEDIEMVWYIDRNYYKEELAPIKYDSIDDMISDLNWRQMYEFAERYNKINGNFHISKEYILEPNFKNLYNWLHVQKENYRNNLLSEDKTELLEKIGIVEKEHKKNL